MQQNVCLLHRRAFLLVRWRPRSLLPRCASPPSTLRNLHQAQRRWISDQAPSDPSPRGGLLGDLKFAHLGGLHYFHVTPPQDEARNDISAWLRVLDACLPEDLRQQGSEVRQTGPSSREQARRTIALLLIYAQRDSNLDLLVHIGAVQNRWSTVSWIIQCIAEGGLPPDLWHDYVHTAPLSAVSKQGISLDDMTKHPEKMINVDVQRTDIDLDQLTQNADPRLYDTRLQQGALGQIWQSLGNMIIRATTSSAEAKTFMPHVLNSLATLHHYGIVPESVYDDVPNEGVGTIRQPPLLHMLSSKIMTALSDAAWDAKKAAEKRDESAGSRKAGWAFGQGVRYYAAAQQLRPEVWLELVLWSCLHGPWVEHGAAILKQIMPFNQDDHTNWSLICWQKLTESANSRSQYNPSFGWRDALDILEGARPEAQPRPTADDRSLIVQTVSSEVIAAYVDAVINQVHTGVGQRGMRIGQVLEHIQSSKRMLSKQKFSLGYATWDSVIQRILNSGAIDLDRDVPVAYELMELVDPYGRELEADNGFISYSNTSAYFIGASALPLKILHNALHLQAKAGNTEGTIGALKALQDFTELNQRRSIQQFFEHLKQHSSATKRPSQLFSTGLAAAEYPSFYPQLPVHVLASFLGIAKDIKDLSFYQWMFDSTKANGPLISQAMYEEAGLAPALVRFATNTNNNDIVESIMLHHSQLSQQQNTLIPTTILTALVEVLVQRRKWPAVHNILVNLIDNYGSDDEHRTFNVWEPQLTAVMSRELLRVERDHGWESDELEQAAKLFTEIVKTSKILPRQQTGVVETDTLYWHLALLASVDARWGDFCGRMKVTTTSAKRSVALAGGNQLVTQSFNVVLEGVLQTRGVAHARKYWDRWCYALSVMQRVRKQEGGIYRVPRLTPNRETAKIPNPWDLQNRVLVDATPWFNIEIRGRVKPNKHSVRLFRDALQADVGKEVDYNVDEMTRWIDAYDQALGFGVAAKTPFLIQAEQEDNISILREHATSVP